MNEMISGSKLEESLDFDETLEVELRSFSSPQEGLKLLTQFCELLDKVATARMPQSKCLTEKEACNALQVGASNLRKMRKNNSLVEGVHFFESDKTIRYHPNIAILAITEGKKNPEKDSSRSRSHVGATPSTRNRTRDAFNNGRK